MKTVLLPTDFSPNASHAIQYAFTLFNKGQRKMILLNSYEPPRPTGMLINIDDIVKKETLNDLREEKELQLAKLNGDAALLTTLAQRGALDEALEAAVKQENADLIVMGTKGASGLKEILVGSNTSKVIKSSIAPVLAVPEEAPNAAPKKIVLAADYERLEDLNCLQPLKDIAQASGASIMIVNVSHKKDGETHFNPVIEKLSLNEFFKDIDHSYHFVESESVEKGLNDFILENGADMLAMIPGRNNFFDSIFHKSITNKMVLHTQIPLLALKKC